MTPTFDTAFCRLVGIRYPIVQAPIGALSTPNLAAAVSEADASSSPKADFDGDIEVTSMWAGQSVGLVETIRPAGDIVREIAEEAATALRHATGSIRD